MNCGTRKKLGVVTLTLLVMTLFFTSTPLTADAVVQGVCSNCHTMHNSQDGSPMTSIAAGESWEATGPQAALLRGTCLGCHGMNTTNIIETLPPGGGAGASYVPQVYHQIGASDLAGGNFAYIMPNNDAKGHNVIELGNQDDVFMQPHGTPPTIDPPGAEHTITGMPPNLTCAGNNGCHGMRDTDGPSDIASIKGAHHTNAGPQLDVADTVANSYRFLFGVKGYENNTNNQTTSWQNIDETIHNEYFGDTLPMDITSLSCDACHISGQINIVRPFNQTISGFCATCHGLFHDLAEMGTSGAFRRHPNDIVIPSGGEFDPYNTYSVMAPVARTGTVASSISPIVVKDSDAVMCLSCHAAHATAHDDMLRWDYSLIQTGGSGGCLICHTSK